MKKCYRIEEVFVGRTLFLIRNKDFYKLLFSITLPIAAQNFITFTVSMADSLMLGKLGETALSAANLANQLFFMLMIITFGVTSAAMVFASQYWGKGDVYSLRRIITIMLRVAFVISLIASVLALCLPEVVMSWYSDDAAVISEGAAYLRIVGWIYPIYSVTNAMVCIFRCAHEVKISIVVYLVSLVVNVFFNWVFIFGNLGSPAMGVRGAALATAVARCAELVILIIYLAAFEKKIHYTFADFFVPVKPYIKDFIKTGAPVILNETVWSIGSSILSMIIGHISTEFVSANSIANVIWQCVWVMISGMGNATAVIIGNAVGLGEDKAYINKMAQSIIVVAGIMGVAAAGIILLIREPVIGFYEVSQSTKDLAMELIVSYAAILVLQSMSVQYVVGIFRGGGDTKFSMLIDTVFLWIFAIPLGAYAGLVLKLAPPIVYLVLRCDEVFKCFVGFIHMKKGRWVRDVTVAEN